MLFTWKRTSLPKLKLKKPTAFCLPGFHIEPVWHRTQAESIEHGLALVREYLLACRADPYYGVFLSEIDYLKPYLDLYPEERAWVAQLIEQERCITGGAYNQPNETSVGGEALIRNLLIGQLYHRTVLNAETPVYMAWDSSGHIPQLPQILSQCDIQAAVFTRSNYRDPSTKIPGMGDLFQWIAPDGSSIYAQRSSFRIPPETSLANEAAKRLQDLKAQQPDLLAVLLLDAGRMATPRTEIVGRCRELAESEPALAITGAAASRYFSYIHTMQNAGHLDLEPVTRDMSQYNEGGELSRIDLKIANRLAENRLYEAELWTALAGLQGFPVHTEEIDYAWRQLLFGQHHGAITGSGNDIVLADLLEGYRNALDSAVSERSHAIEQLASIIHTQTENEQNSFLVFNSLPWRHDALARVWVNTAEGQFPVALRDKNGETILCEILDVQLDADEKACRVLLTWVQPEMPPAGYTQIEKSLASDVEFPSIQKRQSQTWVENEFFRLEVNPDRGGGIVSLYDKEQQKEFINENSEHPGNDLVQLAEGHGEEPALRLLTKGGKTRGSESRAVVEYREGPVSRRLMIRAHGPGPCSRIQEICLYKDLPYIDCTTVLENYKGYGQQVLESDKNPTRDLYVVAFPLDLPGALPVLEDRFYAKAYRRSRGCMDFNSSLHHWDSQHAMNSCYRWVDISWSFMARFISEDTEMASLALGPAEIVIGTAGHRDISRQLMVQLAGHGITGTPRFDRDDPASDRQFRQCSFSLGKKEENTFTQRLLDQNPQALEYYERSLMDIGYAILVVPFSNDKKKKHHKPVFIFAGNTKELLKQAIEEMIQSTRSHAWECPYSSYFMPRQSRVEDAGFAFLNQGNTLCSLEKDGTLAVALMHTVPYPSPQTHWPFDYAEHKTHVFPYRLIPHAGNYRQAEIPRRAMEYNHPPITLETQSHEGILPSSNSFFSLEPSNILISSIKPAGFPEAEHKPSAKPLSSIVVRVHEAYGDESNVWLETSLPYKSVRALQINEQPAVKKREIGREDPFIRTVAHANEIVTLGIDFKTPLLRKDKTEEPSLFPTVSSRYWRCNLGAAPAGFLPVSLTLRGCVRPWKPHTETSIQSLDAVLVNHSPHQTYEGHVEIETPPYWRVLPQSLSYRLAPGAFQIIPFHVVFDTPRTEGYIKVRTQVGNRMVEDIITIGPMPDYELEMTLTRDYFNVILRHPCPYKLTGTVSLISPVESWPETLVDGFSLSSIASKSQIFAIEPGQENTVAFPVTEYQNRFNTPADHSWVVVKICSHYSVRYYHVRLDGQCSEGLGKILAPPYEPLANPGDCS